MSINTFFQRSRKSASTPDATGPTDFSTMRTRTSATSMATATWKELLTNFMLIFRFYNCVHGTPYELPCASGLVFDEAQGTCVREEQASEYAKKCEKEVVKSESWRSIKCHPALSISLISFLQRTLTDSSAPTRTSSDLTARS